MGSRVTARSSSVSASAVLAFTLILLLFASYPKPALAITSNVGATQGSFSVDQNGGANYTIPIFAPPGTAGMVPQIALSYTKQVENPLVGVGFAISGLSVITRCGRTMALDNGVRGGVYYNADDRFCLDGQRLIAISGANGENNTEYRTERETFGRIYSYRDSGFTGSGPQRFKVITKDGMVMEYGYTSDSAVQALSKTTVRLWALNKVIDVKGNYYTVTYLKDTVTNGEYRVSRVDYTGNASAGLSPYNSIRFTYELRPDIAPRYEAGAMIKVTQRLTKIESYADNAVVRTYNLNYDNNGAPQGATGASRLIRVEECGSDGVCLPTSNFQWSGTSTFFQGAASSMNYGTYTSMTNNLADVNGDGCADVVRIDTATQRIWAYLSNCDGTFQGPAEHPGYGTYQSMTSGLADVNGDGCADVVRMDTQSQRIWAYISNCNGTFQGPGEFPGYGTYTSMSNQLADVNGDGCADVVRIDTATQRIWAYISNCNGTFQGAVEHPGYGTYPAMTPALADVNGDGCADVVRMDTQSQRIWAYISNCNGSFQGPGEFPGYGTYTSMTNHVADINGDGCADVVRLDTTTQRMWTYVSNCDGTFQWVGDFPAYGTYSSMTNHLADVNGDGCADVVRLDTTRATQWTYLSFCDGRFEGASETNNYGTIVTMTNDLADINGDGLTDVVRLDTQTQTIWSYLRLGEAANRLSKVTDGIGVSTRIEYKSLTSSSVYTKDSGAVYPYQDTQNSTYVVSRVAHSDGLEGEYAVNYKYGGAKTHLTGPGWLSFRWRKETDERTQITTASYVNQVYDGTDGTPNYTETIAPNGVVMKLEDSFWTGIDLGGGRKFARLDGSLSQSRELNGADVSCARIDNEYKPFTAAGDYGDYGMPYRVVAKMSVLCNDPTPFTKTTTNTYQHDATNNILGRVTSTVMLHEAPGELSITRKSSFAYNTLGMMIEETVEPDSATLWLKTTYGYDAYGNRTSATITGPDIETRGSTTEYDTVGPQRGRFATRTTNALGHISTATYDPKWGAPLTQTDINNITVSYQYDGFGRKVQETRPDSTTTTVTTAWCDTSNPCPSVGSVAPKYSVTSASTGSAPAKAYYDFLGRVIRSEGQSLNGTTIHADTEYDNKGRVARKSHPYFVGGTVYWDAPTYDALSRVIVTTEADGGVTTTEYLGLTTKVTVSGPDITSRWRSTIKNVMGKIASVTDSLYPNNPTTHRYDAIGNLTRVTDPLGSQTNITYDLRGRKTAMSDPNMGNWSYAYNALGELTSQTDAKGQIQTVVYDKLGRITSRTTRTAGGVESSSTWTYDTAPLGTTGTLAKGRLTQTSGPGTATDGFSAGYLQTYTYDDLGRSISITTKIGGTNYTSSTTYDTLSRVETVSFPQTNFTVKRVYNVRGQLFELRNNQTNALLWRALDDDAKGHITREEFGNNLTTERSYNAVKNTLNSIRTTGTNGAVQDLEYNFDVLGSLLTRLDRSQSGQVLTESFEYDELNRLKRVTGPATKDFTYNEIGNITSKSDVGSYNYGSGGVQPHAVKSTSGTLNNTYTYDNNGNMIGGAGRTVTYTTFNKPSKIVKGGNTTTFAYDPGFNRIKKVTATSTTIYVGTYQRVTTGSLVEHKHYIGAGSATILYTQPNVGTPTTRYLHTDHLGSTHTITKEDGTVDGARLAFDAHGKRRQPNWQDATGPITAPTPKGFTGHDMDDESDLINMNARLYDPILGRFISPDTVVESMAGQGLNRYTYVQNNPLSLTDPTGNWSLKKFFKAEVEFIKKPTLANYFNKVAAQPFQEHIDKAIMSNSTLYAVGQWAATYFTFFCGGCGGVAYSAYYTYQATGSTSKAVKAGAISYATSAASAYVGANFSGVEKVAADAVVKGVSSELSGGSFKNGFMSGLASGLVENAGYRGSSAVGNIVSKTIVGGLAAELSGGEFKDGAKFSFVTSSASSAYQGIVGYAATWESGGAAVEKNPLSYPVQGANNIGTAEKTLDPKCWFCEGGYVSRALNAVPGGNAVAGMHDVFQVDLQKAGGVATRNILNLPGIPVAAAVTGAALLDNPTAFMLYQCTRGGSQCH